MSVLHGNTGANDESASMKSTSPPETSASSKRTTLPVNMAPRKLTVPPENLRTQGAEDGKGAGDDRREDPRGS